MHICCSDTIARHTLIVVFLPRGVKDELKLEPRKAQLYTWQQPMGNRKLVWKVDEKENTNNLIKVREELFA